MELLNYSLYFFAAVLIADIALSAVSMAANLIKIKINKGR